MEEIINGENKRKIIRILLLVLSTMVIGCTAKGNETKVEEDKTLKLD